MSTRVMRSGGAFAPVLRSLPWGRPGFSIRGTALGKVDFLTQHIAASSLQFSHMRNFKSISFKSWFSNNRFFQTIILPDSFKNRFFGSTYSEIRNPHEHYLELARDMREPLRKSFHSPLKKNVPKWAHGADLTRCF